MTDKEERKNEMKKGARNAIKIAEEAKIAHDKLKGNIQKNKELCSYLNTIYETNKFKSDMLTTFIPYAIKADNYSWEQSQGTFNADVTQLEELQRLNDEIDKESSLIDEWATSACSGSIMAKSSLNSYYTNFQIVVPMEILGEIKIVEGFPDYTIEIMNTLEQDFTKKSAEEFKKIIDEWNSSSTDNKHSRLNDLRNYIFDELIGSLDPIWREYKLPLWNKRYKGMDYKEQFTKTRFFILGYRMEDSIQKLLIYHRNTSVTGLNHRYINNFY